MAEPAPSVAFVVPALNEEANLEPTVRGILKALEGRPNPGRILVFDDGSTDATGALADRLAAADPRVRALHNGRTMGLGYNYFHGLELASEDYVMMVPGDNEIPETAIQILLDQLGKADLIVPYLTGSEARPWGRRLVSRAFVMTLNLLFGLSLKYYNGPCLLKRALVLSVPVRTEGFAYMAAILVTLLGEGHSYVEVAIPLQFRSHGSSKAVRWKNIASVLGTLWRLLVQPRKKFS